MDNDTLLIVADFLDETNHQGQAFAKMIRESIEPPPFYENEIYGFIVKGVADNLIVFDQEADCETFTKRLIYLMKDQVKSNHPHRSLEHIILPYTDYMDFCVRNNPDIIEETPFTRCFSVNVIPTFVPMLDYFTNLNAYVEKNDSEICIGVCNDRHIVLGCY